MMVTWNSLDKDQQDLGLEILRRGVEMSAKSVHNFTNEDVKIEEFEITELPSGEDYIQLLGSKNAFVSEIYGEANGISILKLANGDQKRLYKKCLQEDAQSTISAEKFAPFILEFNNATTSAAITQYADLLDIDMKNGLPKNVTASREVIADRFTYRMEKENMAHFMVHAKLVTSESNIALDYYIILEEMVIDEIGFMAED